jgi:hypothetical protein
MDSFHQCSHYRLLHAIYSIADFLFLLRVRLLQRSLGFEYEMSVRNAPKIGLMFSVVVFLSKRRMRTF